MVCLGYFHDLKTQQGLKKLIFKDKYKNTHPGKNKANIID